MRTRRFVRSVAVLAAFVAASAGESQAAPLPPAPAVVTVATARGEARLAVSFDSGAGPVISGAGLVSALNGAVRTDQAWAEVTLARQSFRFLLGAPMLAFNDRVQPLVGWAFVARDSLFLPLQFVAEVLPDLLGERYNWDPLAGRLREMAPPPPPVRAATPRPVTRPAEAARLPNGLLPGHLITIDAGHGGIDPGNPGAYFPRGVQEKDVTLQVALLLRNELKSRGVGVVMTRSTDTLISYLDRTGYCTDQCDLFVSLHVDALGTAVRRRWGAIRGFHTIVIGEENTEDADRIAQMENDALRYENVAVDASTGGLDFILRNLQRNEYLRESARAAELVQENVDRVHTGENRGVKQSNRLAVLNTARRPAILIEMGFSTNPQDARLLVGRKSQQALATAIADAIIEYLREYERKTGDGSVGGSGR